MLEGFIRRGGNPSTSYAASALGQRRDPISSRGKGSRCTNSSSSSTASRVPSIPDQNSEDFEDFDEEQFFPRDKADISPLDTPIVSTEKVSS
jgi:hypothetical protein